MYIRICIYIYRSSRQPPCTWAAHSILHRPAKHGWAQQCILSNGNWQALLFLYSKFCRLIVNLLNYYEEIPGHFTNSFWAGGLATVTLKIWNTFIGQPICLEDYKLENTSKTHPHKHSVLFLLVQARMHWSWTHLIYLLAICEVLVPEDIRCTLVDLR